MKKYTIIFIVLTLGITILFSFTKQVETTTPVSNIMDDKVIKYMNNNIEDLVKKETDFNNYYLLFDTYKINSNDLEVLFSFFESKYEYHILAIYPYINPIYADKLRSIENISFSGDNLKEGITNFYNKYITILDGNNLNDEIEKTYINGISIRMIKVNTSNIAMYNFLKNYPDIKYSLSVGDIFKTIRK